MTDTKPLVPCYVLGLESQIGLSIVRELGKAGVPVIGIAQVANAIGLRSRYLKASAVLQHPRSPEGLIELRALSKRFGPGYILTVSESNTRWLIENTSQLEDIRPIVPPREAFETVLDKEKTLLAAIAVGLKVPLSVCLRHWEDVENIAESFNFPGVLKWSDPNQVAETLGRAEIELIKAEYVYSKEEFLRIAERYKPIGIWPMLQEYCSGVGLGQFFYIHEGEAVRRFQHIRIAEWPPEGGFSSVCDAVSLDRFKMLQEKSILLLQNIGWEGVAMVEFRFDPITQQAVLMEINGRFWGSLPLAMHCGVGFSILAYYFAAIGAPPQLQTVRDDLRCRMIATEIKRLNRIIFQRDKIRDKNFVTRPVYEVLRFILDFFSPTVRYYVWSIRDPLPFFQDIFNVFRK